MNLQQAVQPKASSNGFGRRRGGDRDVGNKLHSGKLNSGRIQSAGPLTGGKVGGYDSPSRDRLVYLTTCLIGHPVEVHVKNGSIYSGIFHATEAEKDFGVILKMARLTKDGTLRGQKAISEFVSKAPSKTLIIPGKELVEIVAKDVTVTREGFVSELQLEKQQELMTDSMISQSHHAEVERELEPWVPDEDDPQCPELENIFDDPWNRSWNQFETNEVLFGVKSTFNEELYTTKLEKGPRMKELEKEAIRIAREIEGESTQDLHLAEERGYHLHDNFDIDEETRFSSVYRGGAVDDSGLDEENEEILFNSRNNETFADASASSNKRPTDLICSKSSDGARVSSSSSIVDEAPSSLSSISTDLHRSGSNDHARQLASELPSKSFSATDSERRIQDDLFGDRGGSGDAKEWVEKQSPSEDVHLSSSSDSQSIQSDKIESSEKGGPSTSTNACASSNASLKSNGKPSTSSEPLDSPAPSKAHAETQSSNSRGRPGSSTSSNSDYVSAATASTAPGLSPSSSMGSFSSEKSTLNPHAKEFKLNPNAKSFIPSQVSVRPPSPVSDGSFYYPTSMSPVAHMHGMPVGFGLGPSFAGQQPVIFNPPVAPVQTPQAYYHPNGPQYGQQMLLGQSRQVLYMPGYPEMPYKGREY